MHNASWERKCILHYFRLHLSHAADRRGQEVRVSGIRIVGTGMLGGTHIYDAETGEELSARYLMSGFTLKVGSASDGALPTLVLELVCPVEIELTGPPELVGTVSLVE